MGSIKQYGMHILIYMYIKLLCTNRSSFKDFLKSADKVLGGAPARIVLVVGENGKLTFYVPLYQLV